MNPIFLVKVESWLYVVYVHRKDRGGQFISYRQMRQWKNAVACQLQKSSTWQQLQLLWSAILHDHTKHNSQYNDSALLFLEKIWAECQDEILKESQGLEPNNIAICISVEYNPW